MEPGIKMKIENMPISAGEKEKAARNITIRKACNEFEAIFTNEILKSMRRTVEKSDLFHGGQAEEIYESMLDQELAKSMAGRGGNSLGELMYRQLKIPDSVELAGKGAGFPYRTAGTRLPMRPLAGEVSSDFGWRKDPFTGNRRFHRGIDIPAEEGMEIKAVMSGRVLLSEKQSGYGNVVVLDHGHGFTSLYAHNRENRVKPGDWIEQGQTVAEVGSTGRSTGPHLHLEIRRDGKHLDPVKFIEG